MPPAFIPFRQMLVPGPREWRNAAWLRSSRDGPRGEPPGTREAQAAQRRAAGWPQYLLAIGSSSAGNRLMTWQPLSVTTTSSSMRAAE